MPEQPCIYVATQDFSALLAQGGSFAAQLHPDDQQPLASHPKRRFIQQFSRWQRRQLFAQVLQASADMLSIQTDSYGKPFMASHPRLAFNQSHSDSMLALCYSLDVAQIGIDIEDRNRVMRVDALAQHSLTVAEYARFKQATAQQAYWLKLWTIKEAVLKASGIGIRLSLDQLETGCAAQQQRGSVFHPKIGQWQYACFELEQHVLSVSWQEPEPSRKPSTAVQIIFRDDVPVQV